MFSPLSLSVTLYNTCNYNCIDLNHLASLYRFTFFHAFEADDIFNLGVCYVFLLGLTRIPFLSDSVDSDQTAQNVQSDLNLRYPINNYPSFHFRLLSPPPPPLLI